MKRFLVIQTAFLGDAVLATALINKLHKHYPDAHIDMVVRKGNEGIFGTGDGDENSPNGPIHQDGKFIGFHKHRDLHTVFIWDKRSTKTRNLFTLIKDLRRTKYDAVINCQRFFSTGLMTVLARGHKKIGYRKNPLSFLFSRRVAHEIGDGRHEVDRLNDLIKDFTDDGRPLPKLFPDPWELEPKYPQLGSTLNEDDTPYFCIAPASVWFTKQWPESKWIALILTLPEGHRIFLIGAPSDKELCDRIVTTAGRGINLAGELSLLQTAALMEDAEMNYVNDSAPLHIASAMNAPVTAVFCSTVPSFGFGPLRENGRVVETTEKLDCRPCGLHGHRECPKGHFRCALGIEAGQLSQPDITPQ